jgi:hypothetical protein
MRIAGRRGGGAAAHPDQSREHQAQPADVALAHADGLASGRFLHARMGVDRLLFPQNWPSLEQLRQVATATRYAAGP